MRAMRLSMVAVPICALLADAHGPALAAGLSGCLPTMIKQLLGAGGSGRGGGAEPLTDDLAALREGTWIYRTVSGKNRGRTEAHVVSRLKRDDSGASWRYDAGPEDILFLHVAEHGSITMVTEQAVEEGAAIEYMRAQPLLIPDLAPGESSQFSIGVKIYDLSHPDHLEHGGQLDLTSAIWAPTR